MGSVCLRTTLCVRFKSEVVACGVVYAAARRFQVPLPENPPWWKAFDAEKSAIDEICRVLTYLYSLPRAQYIPVCKDGKPFTFSTRSADSQSQPITKFIPRVGDTQSAVSIKFCTTQVTFSGSAHQTGWHLGIHLCGCYEGLILDQLTQNLQKFDQLLQESEHMHRDCPQTPSPPPLFDYFKSVTSIWEGQKVGVNGFLGNLKFARVGGVPSGMVGVASQVNEEGDDGVSTGSRVETAGNSPQKLASGILSIPLSNVERLKSTLSTVSLTELIELLPLLGRSSQDHPDKKKLFSVQDFFRYTESEGRRFFEELDRDGDGQVTLDDLEVAMRKRKLPQRYAREFMRRTRSHLFSKSFNWKQFLSLMEQKEPTILRAYTSLCLSKSGTLQKSEILASLQNAGLPANEDNAVAMMRFLNADTEESISYGHFRNFMLLLPSDRLLQDDPRHGLRTGIFEASKLVLINVAPNLPDIQLAQQLLRRELEPWETIVVGALSGGLAAVVTTPFDVMKTRMMTAPGGQPVSMSVIAFSILRHEGPLGLFKGAVPRFFWIAPLGAMNFAGYELARKAMVKNEEAAMDQLSQKKLAKI
ncbi:hypothetical protein V6N12_026980 [Hibiscus sabdariffa]|uniref:EF-hand domain-containing protein n=1 Tax=Hibiscus sabdariffa TaxID=183260 RepID=A0ABR2DV30_9ROSI